MLEKSNIIAVKYHLRLSKTLPHLNRKVKNRISVTEPLRLIATQPLLVG